MLSGAVARLRDHLEISIVANSSIYETEPVGVLEQPKFLNAVVAIKTTLTPEALLAVLMQVEAAFARERRERWGPRTLDLDLLAFEGERRDTATLTLPHPRMFERAFVMVPLLELLTSPPLSSAIEWNDLRCRIRPLAAEDGIVRQCAAPDGFG